MEREGDEHCSRLGIEARRHRVLDAFFCSLRSRLIDHLSLVDPFRYFLNQDMASDLEVYLSINFTVGRNHTDGLRFATSNAVETHSVTLGQDVSSILTHLHGRLATLASKLLVT